MMQPEDRVYFVCDEKHAARAMASFGHTEEQSHSIVISGGGNIGTLLAQNMEMSSDDAQVHIIERDRARARKLAEQLQKTSVIWGNTLEADILKEAGANTAGTFVAVSNDDEVNILSALLAKRMGALHTVALVNMPGFVPLSAPLVWMR